MHEQHHSLSASSWQAIDLSMAVLGCSRSATDSVGASACHPLKLLMMNSVSGMYWHACELFDSPHVDA